MREACELQDSAHGEVISVIGRLGFFMISHPKTAHANSTSRMKIKPLILKGSIWPWGQSDRILEISDRKVRIAVCSATIKACHKRMIRIFVGCIIPTGGIEVQFDPRDCETASNRG